VPQVVVRRPKQLSETNPSGYLPDVGKNFRRPNWEFSDTLSLIPHSADQESRQRLHHLVVWSGYRFADGCNRPTVFTSAVGARLLTFHGPSLFQHECAHTANRNKPTAGAGVGLGLLSCGGNPPVGETFLAPDCSGRSRGDIVTIDLDST